MPEKFNCRYGSDNTVIPYGIDYGAPLEIVVKIDPYVLIKRRGHMTWDGIGSPRRYVPTRYMILRMTPLEHPRFEAEVLIEKESDKANFRQTMLEMRNKLAELAANYQGKAVDEWVIYELTSGEFFLGHLCFIDNLDRMHLDKIKDIDGKETETKQSISPARVLVHNADFDTYDDLYNLAYIIKADWNNLSVAINAHRRELDRQWQAGRDQEKASMDAIRKKFRNTP